MGFLVFFVPTYSHPYHHVLKHTQEANNSRIFIFSTRCRNLEGRGINVKGRNCMVASNENIVRITSGSASRRFTFHSQRVPSSKRVSRFIRIYLLCSLFIFFWCREKKKKKLALQLHLSLVIYML